jgi:hypothetical protein
MGTIVVHLNDLPQLRKGARLEDWASMLQEHMTSYLVGGVRVTVQPTENTITISHPALLPEKLIACVSQPLFGFGARIEISDYEGAGMVPCKT